MEMYIWNTVIVISKLMFYTGVAAVAGYTFFAYSNLTESKSAVNVNYRKLTTAFVILAIVATFVWFFATTGAMAEDGIQGAFDPDMVSIMWSTAIGDTTLMRGLGLLAALAIISVSSTSQSAKYKHYIEYALMMAIILVLAYSFILLGHVSELNFIKQLLLMFHVLVMAWWFGALYPLKLACNYLSDDKLLNFMESFGRQASVLVSLLFIAGLILVTQLVNSFDDLLKSSYGQVLLLKLSLVICILAIAARHKLKLVPELKNRTGRQLLSKSITIEMMIAFAILLVTAALTSVVGPAS
ncbi:CopD family protein [Alteromonas sp. NFXS44]|uniref:copper resistance D family protein n=1 Tax=Alteromonas sp. NFXS44 TaxID=2818435 RepID=UPI0032DEBF79